MRWEFRRRRLEPANHPQAFLSCDHNFPLSAFWLEVKREAIFVIPWIARVYFDSRTLISFAL